MISQKAKQGQEAEEGKNTNLSKEVEKRHLSKRSVTVIKMERALITSVVESS